MSQHVTDEMIYQQTAIVSNLCWLVTMAQLYLDAKTRGVNRVWC
jgi:hypothetical protein